MMTASRYICAVVVLVVASLTPSSCSELGEQALAFEESEPMAIEEFVFDGDVRGAAHRADRKPASDSNETGS